MSDTYERFVELLKGFGAQPDEVCESTTFMDLEFDSLALVELTLAAQQEFNVPIGDDELSAEDTMAHVAKVIDAKLVEV